VTLELLSSDLGGSYDALDRLVHGAPLEVFAHNVECVERLDRVVRDPRASFNQSLRMLERVKRLAPRLFSKSSLMLGVGETDAEVVDALRQLRFAGVDIVTLGQYLAPSFRHLRVARYVSPDRFAGWLAEAREMGFRAVAAGPLVRSSYRAGQLLREAQGISTRCVSSSIA
jgi:lipoic acid synthetase